MVAVLLAVATFFLALATFFLFGWITIQHPFGWLAAGLTLWCLAVLLGAVTPYIQTRNQ